MANNAPPRSALELAEMAQLLVASGQYRVQRRLETRTAVSPPADVALKTAIFLDVETTGLDPSKDEVIELAMVPFT
jgi:DNA polymerase-3 subunit epsilon